MTKLVEAIAKSLVDRPENVEVTETSTRQGTVVQLKVDPDDMGKVMENRAELRKHVGLVLRLPQPEKIKK